MSHLSLTGYDANNQRVQNVASAASGTDAVNKNDLDNAVRGLDWKQEVVAASTANVSITSAPATLDGITLTAGDRVLLKDQTAPAENGIRVFTAAGAALARSLDADSWAELTGSTVTVQRGTVNADRVYRVNSDDGGTLDTTAVTFAQVGGGGAAKTAGNGLTETGSTYDVGAGTGITVAADTVGIDASVVPQKFSALCVVTTNPQTFNHGKNSSDPKVSVRRVSDGKIVWADVTVTDANNISVDFGGAPTAGQYRVSVDA